MSSDLPDVRRALETLRDAVGRAVDQYEPFEVERLEWTKAIPHTDKAGVYLIFSKDGDLQYVGKSEGAMGNRVWSHLVLDEEGEIAWKFGGDGVPSPYSVATIPLERDFCYLAPALEGLLIRTLHPPLNTAGRVEPE